MAAVTMGPIRFFTSVIVSACPRITGIFRLLLTVAWEGFFFGCAACLVAALHFATSLKIGISALDSTLLERSNVKRANSKKTEEERDMFIKYIFEILGRGAYLLRKQ